LKKCGAPITAEEIGIPQNKIIEAILSAYNIRRRYTILREGISEKSALEAAKMISVI
jgi:glycerol-1-phosphate dehydrogenase [NAD(P)+]